MAGSANVETPDAGVGTAPLLRASREGALYTVLSNSFGFGGTNACLVLQRAR
jgi:3-oxoacyl-[acyl-carrier-protein] synthase-1